MDDNKMKFRRGLFNEDSVSEVKKFLSTEIGRIICDTDSMQLCIRDNYINIYYKGCSVLKYSPLAKKNKYLVHHKYIGVGDKGTYVPLDLDNNDDFNKLFSLLSNPENTLNDNNYVRGEKSHLANYLLNAEKKWFLLDLEVAFTRERDEEEKAKLQSKREYISDRIDMARIVKDKDGTILQFVEVKVDTDSRLRSSKDGGQEILRQMKHYRDFLKDQKNDIQKSYKKIANNYLELKLFQKYPESRNVADILKAFSESGRLYPKPLLLIIGDKNNMKGNYGDHAKLLNKKLMDNGYDEAIYCDKIGT